MKILVSAAGNDLSAKVDPRFGRAANFLVVDADTMEFEVVANTQNLNAPQGAGIQAGKTAVNTGAEVVITGNCGPKAFSVLRQAGLQVVIGAEGKIEDVVIAYKNGELQPASDANVEGHWV
ncbi:MAG: NifB/NifX family molybdenum-iron cluster-binding protein [Desulfosudaceae bacterium]